MPRRPALTQLIGAISSGDGSSPVRTRWLLVIDCRIVGWVSPPGPVYGHVPAEADWLRDRLTGRIGTVTGTVPDGYPAYVRLLHPAGEDPLTAWSDVARELGTRVHPTVQWHRLVGSDDPHNARGSRRPDLQPPRGNLPPAALRRLLGVLARHTATSEDCRFCTWIGYGWDSPGHRFVELPGREYVVGGGTLVAALHNGEPPAAEPAWRTSPNLFWPSDRAWVVATAIDFDSTLIAGSRELAQALLDDAVLEALPIDPHDSLQHDADRLN